MAFIKSSSDRQTHTQTDRNTDYRMPSLAHAHRGIIRDSMMYLYLTRPGNNIRYPTTNDDVVLDVSL